MPAFPHEWNVPCSFRTSAVRKQCFKTRNKADDGHPASKPIPPSPRPSPPGENAPNFVRAFAPLNQPTAPHPGPLPLRGERVPEGRVRGSSDAFRIAKERRFMGSLHDSSIAHWDHEPWRSGVSVERRNSWEQQSAAVCRDAATGGRFMGRVKRSPRGGRARGFRTFDAYRRLFHRPEERARLRGKLQPRRSLRFSFC